MRSKKELAVFLSKLRTFSIPNVKLEQYPTDSEIASDILWTAHLQGDIEDKTVADLGCGTGILGIGALILGAKHVTFLDVDEHALTTLRKNLATIDDTQHTTIIHADIGAFHDHVDTILQNPPFGTRNTGEDIRFLEHALAHATKTYSLHKTSTEQYIQKIITRNNATLHFTKQYAFPLKQTMPQHKKRIERIDVSCFAVEKQHK